MEKCVIYLHGWKSGPESNTKKIVEEAFPGLKVVGFAIDHAEDPYVTERNLDARFHEVLVHYHPDEIIVLGSSAGGFWANHFARIYGTKVILVNPSLKLGASLAKYGLIETLLNQYNHFPVCKRPVKGHAVFIGEDDDLVDNTDIGWYFKNVILLADEGHRLKDFAPVINMIKEMVHEDIQDAHN